MTADMRKMLPKHDMQMSDDAVMMKGLFWNPMDVADIAWRELINKISAVAAISRAGEVGWAPQPSKKARVDPA